MGILKDAVDGKKFDVRLIEKNVSRGIVTRAETDKFLNSLPDDGTNAEWVNTETLADTEDESFSESNGRDNTPDDPKPSSPETYY